MLVSAPGTRTVSPDGRVTVTVPIGSLSAGCSSAARVSNVPASPVRKCHERRQRTVTGPPPVHAAPPFTHGTTSAAV